MLCGMAESVANHDAECALASFRLDVMMKMHHAKEIHGLSHNEAVAFVVGCYVTVNAKSLSTAGLRALGVIVGELASSL